MSVNADVESQPVAPVMLVGTGPGTAGQSVLQADEHIRMYLAQGLEMSTLTLALGGTHKDSSGKLWSIYLTEADKRDVEMTGQWRGEADSILVFVRVHIPPVFYHLMQL